jgi:hypothetical protein
MLTDSSTKKEIKSTEMKTFQLFATIEENRIAYA